MPRRPWWTRPRRSPLRPATHAPSSAGSCSPHGVVTWAEASILIEALEREAPARGDGAVLTAGEGARAVLHNGLGQYETALAAAQQASAQDELGATSLALPELVEAAVRSGRPQVAADALERLSGADPRGRDRVRARHRGALARADERRRAGRGPLPRGDRTARPYANALEVARAHLLYGEWLRRENRRVDAREQLRSAHELFSSMGADGFAERAARELLATGGKARKRTPDTRGELTAQEAQIAQLAREGYSNPEIGAQLFISPRTVEYHLHKVFTKLDDQLAHPAGRSTPQRDAGTPTRIGRRLPSVRSWASAPRNGSGPRDELSPHVKGISSTCGEQSSMGRQFYWTHNIEANVSPQLVIAAVPLLRRRGARAARLRHRRGRRGSRRRRRGRRRRKAGRAPG